MSAPAPREPRRRARAAPGYAHPDPPRVEHRAVVMPERDPLGYLVHLPHHVQLLALEPDDHEPDAYGRDDPDAYL